MIHTSFSPFSLRNQIFTKFFQECLGKQLIRFHQNLILLMLHMQFDEIPQDLQTGKPDIITHPGRGLVRYDDTQDTILLPGTEGN